MAVEEEAAPGVPEWVVTFGDMMSLLLTFFIMLVSLSEVKQEEKYQALVESMRKQFGHSTSMDSMAPGNSKPRNARLAKLAAMGRAKLMNTARGGDRVRAPVGENPRVRTIRRGEQLTRGGVVYFGYGETELTEEHRRRLQIVVEEIGGKPQKIEIRGHTGRRDPPSGSHAEDNWQLAYARSRSVLDFLVEAGIRTKRVRLGVAGSHEPSHIGVDALLARENERVEIVMIDELVQDLEGDKEAQDRRFSDKNSP